MLTDRPITDQPELQRLISAPYRASVGTGPIVPFHSNALLTRLSAPIPLRPDDPDGLRQVIPASRQAP